MEEIIFLTLAEVIDIHADQIARYGGSGGVRDMHLLSSAVATPSASFGGAYLHGDLYEMAAAYAFHIAQNHPFLDGNKRAALASALVFLELNGVSIADPRGALYDAMIGIATGAVGKAEMARIFQKLSPSR